MASKPKSSVSGFHTGVLLKQVCCLVAPAGATTRSPVTAVRKVSVFRMRSV